MRSALASTLLGPFRRTSDHVNPLCFTAWCEGQVAAHVMETSVLSVGLLLLLLLPSRLQRQAHMPVCLAVGSAVGAAV
jgi:hypothetical protein